MYKSKDYIIEFNKVKLGLNTYEFYLDSAFIEALSGGEITLPANVKVQLELTRSEMMHDLRFHFTGTVSQSCDICLKELDWGIDYHSHLIIKLSEFEKYDDDEIVYVLPQTVTFDLSQILYDNLMVAIPIKKTCEMIGSQCDIDLNQINTTNNQRDDESGDSDPRWDKLKDILK